MINQKGFTNISLVIALIIVLIGIVGYFTLVKKSGPITSQPTETSGPSPNPTLNWKMPTNKAIPLQKSGINGTAMLNDKPLAKFNLDITNEIPDFKKEITTDNNGRFQIELSPSQYTIAPGNGNSQDTNGGPFSVDVKPGILKEVKLQFNINPPQ